MTIAPSPVLPKPDETTLFYWRAAAEHRLEILRCQNCGHYRHWPRPVCNKCSGWDLRPALMSGSGRLVSWCSVIQPFHAWFADKVPYVVAVIELPEQPGLKLVTNIIDHAGYELRIGMPLTVGFVSLDAGVTLPVFRPADLVDHVS